MRVLLSFMSRNQTFQCSNMLRSNGYTASVSDTPISFHGCCALSVYTSYEGYTFITKYLHNFSAFQGAYKYEDGKYTRIF